MRGWGGRGPSGRIEPLREETDTDRYVADINTQNWSFEMRFHRWGGGLGFSRT